LKKFKLLFHGIYYSKLITEIKFQMDDYLTPFEVEHHVNELKEIDVE